MIPLRAAPALALAIAAALLAAPLASAHTAGAPPVSRSGSFLLQPSGSENSTVHVDIRAFDLPISGGDALEINWSANAGAGPAIEFWIHGHSDVSGTVNYYNATARFLNTTWKVPSLNDNSTFMVLFLNPSIAPINVTYSFLLMAPPAEFAPALFLFLAVGGVAFGWFLYIRAGRPGAKSEGKAADRDAAGRGGSDE